MNSPSPIALTMANSGLPGIGLVPWGAHLCHFYRAGDELLEPVIDFFLTGLAENQSCLWIVAGPAAVARARKALSGEVGDLIELERRGKMLIVDNGAWLNQGMSSATLMQDWLQREQQARDAGFSGLRISGDLTWLSENPDGGRAEYEALHNRRVLVLGSYSLDRCSADEVLDILRRNKFALVRRAGGWETVYSATQLLSAINTTGTAPHAEHVVCFFRQDTYPADEIAGYLATAPGAGAALVSTAHLALLKNILENRRVATDAVQLHDAEILLEAARRRNPQNIVGELQPFLAGLVRSLCADGRTAHLYGEIVDLLCQQGQPEIAVQLEQAWNDLLYNHKAVLWCGYDLANVESGGIETYSAICTCHGEVKVDILPQDQQLHTQMFLAELAHRREYEFERSRLLQAEREANRRLAILQHITTALSETIDSADVAAVVCRDLTPRLGAARAYLVVPDDDMALRPVGCVGYSEEQVQSHIFTSIHANLPTTEVLRTGQPLWLHAREDIVGRYPDMPVQSAALACLPLLLRGQIIGLLTIGYDAPQEFDRQQRALLEDIRDQFTLALERARLYEEVERQRNQAEIAGLAKDRFLAMLGHELRNPLAAIHTAAELLVLSGNDPAKLRRTQTILSRQAGHMAKLIDDLLDVSRIVWGKISLTLAPVDLIALLQELAGDRAEQAEQQSIQLMMTLDRDPLWIQGDRVRLVQIFDNILANALKFTPSGGEIQVSTECVHNQVQVTIRDSGAGIDPDLLPKIFEPFQQASQDIARSSGGLGLGLALVKGLVELHGGTATVRSDGPGLGSAITIQLPLAQEFVRAQNDDGAAVSRAARVLIVEDNQDSADLMGELLQASGHRVAIVYRGDQALDTAAAFKPELVLCDIGLPGALNGYDVARAFSADPCRRSVYLVALTGYGAPEDAQRAHDAGFHEHLTKPIRLDQVDAILARMRAAGA